MSQDVHQHYKLFAFMRSKPVNPKVLKVDALEPEDRESETLGQQLTLHE